MESFFSARVAGDVGSLEVILSVKRTDSFSFDEEEDPVIAEDKLEEDECDVESEFGEKEDSSSFAEEDPVIEEGKLTEDECDVESE